MLFIIKESPIEYEILYTLRMLHVFYGGIMTKLYEIYVCPVCANRVEVVHDGAGTLTCCGQPMKLAVAGTSDGAAEKHVPVIENLAGGYRVKVGSVEHPSTEAHYIEWIAIETTTGQQLPLQRRRSKCWPVNIVIYTAYGKLKTKKREL